MFHCTFSMKKFEYISWIKSQKHFMHTWATTPLDSAGIAWTSSGEAAEIFTVNSPSSPLCGTKPLTAAGIASTTGSLTSSFANLSLDGFLLVTFFFPPSGWAWSPRLPSWDEVGVWSPGAGRSDFGTSAFDSSLLRAGGWSPSFEILSLDGLRVVT